MFSEKAIKNATFGKNPTKHWFSPLIYISLYLNIVQKFETAEIEILNYPIQISSSAVEPWI